MSAAPDQPLQLDILTGPCSSDAPARRRPVTLAAVATTLLLLAGATVAPSSAETPATLDRPPLPLTVPGYPTGACLVAYVVEVPPDPARLACVGPSPRRPERIVVDTGSTFYIRGVSGAPTRTTAPVPDGRAVSLVARRGPVAEYRTRGRGVVPFLVTPEMLCRGFHRVSSCAAFSVVVGSRSVELGAPCPGHRATGVDPGDHTRTEAR